MWFQVWLTMYKYRSYMFTISKLKYCINYYMYLYVFEELKRAFI